MIDAYKIGVTIALQNGMSSVLNIIQKDVLGLKKAVDMTASGFGRMKIAVAGAAAVFAGGLMIKGMYDLSKHGDKYIQQLEHMKVAGLSVQEQAIAIASANKVSSAVMTTSPTENIENFLRLREALAAHAGQGLSMVEANLAATREAATNAPALAIAQAVMKNAAATGRMTHGDGGDVFEMVKALEEIKATNNPDRFNDILQGWVRATVAGGGQLNSKDFMQTLKYTRTAGQYYDPEFLKFYLPTLMQEFKTGGGSGAGGGPGQPLGSLFQAVVGNVMSRSAINLGEKLGLIDPNKVHIGAHAQITKDPGAWYGADVAARNPYYFARDFLAPMLSKQMGGHMMDTNKDGTFVHLKEVAGTLATLFGNRSAQQMVALLMNVPKLEAARKLTEATPTTDAMFEELKKNSPVMAREEATAQLDRALTDLGKNTAVTTLIYNIAKALSWFSDILERHEHATRLLLYIGAGLGAFLVVLGSAAVTLAGLSAIGGAAAAFGLGGTIALAATAFSAAIAALAYFFPAIVRTLRGWGAAIDAALMPVYQWLRKSADQLGSSIKTYATNITSFAANELLTLWASVGMALDKLISSLGAWFKALPGRIAGMLPGPDTAPPDPRKIPYQPMSYHPVMPLNHAPTTLHATTNIHLDGRKFASVVNEHLVSSMRRPQQGYTGPDIRNSPVSAFAGALA